MYVLMNLNDYPLADFYDELIDSDHRPRPAARQCLPIDGACMLAGLVQRSFDVGQTYAQAGKGWYSDVWLAAACEVNATRILRRRALQRASTVDAAAARTRYFRARRPWCD